MKEEKKQEKMEKEVTMSLSLRRNEFVPLKLAFMKLDEPGVRIRGILSSLIPIVFFWFNIAFNQQIPISTSMNCLCMDN